MMIVLLRFERNPSFGTHKYFLIMSSFILCQASTVSTVDVLLRRDLWHQEIKHPCKMGCDLVGRVINVGDKCEDIKIGDRVCAVGLAIGGNAKYAILPSSRVFCCPEDIHPTKVACLVRNYMTAYQCLHRAGGAKIRPGSKVLILGGAGALGQALIQLSIVAGADEVYATGKGSISKRIIENLGAQALGRKPGEWLPYVKGEMDIVVDSVCSDDYISSQRALKRSGKLVCVGATALVKKPYNWNSGMDPKKRFHVVELASSMPNTSFYDVFSSLEMKRDVFRRDLFRLFHLCRNHEITPKVAFCVTLDEVANAQLDLEVGGIDGSIICLPFGPEGKKISSREVGEDLITEYEDGIEVRQSIVGGQIQSLFGKVMKDGTFKILSNDRESFNTYDDDLYSRAGDIKRPSTRGGLKRVDSTPFGFQDDMDRSYHRAAFVEDEEDDSGTKFSTYSARDMRTGRKEEDGFSQVNRHMSHRRLIPRQVNDDPDDYIYGQRNSSKSRKFGDIDDLRSVRSSSRRGSTRNTSMNRSSARDVNDDAVSVRSSSRRRSTNRNISSNIQSERRIDVDDDGYSVRSGSPRHVSSRSRKIDAPGVQEGEYAGSRRSRSRGGSLHPEQEQIDSEIKRAPSILRNGNGSSRARSGSRGASYERRPSNPVSSPRGSPSRYSTSRLDTTQPVPRARSRSRDPTKTHRGERGRTRSRSLDTRADDRERQPSLESEYSQETHQSTGSAYTKESVYTEDEASVAHSVSTKESDHKKYEQKPRTKEKKSRSSRKVVKEVRDEETSTVKKGLFSRLRSMSNLKVTKENSRTSVSVKAASGKHSSSLKLKSRPVESRKSPKKETHQGVSRTHPKNSDTRRSSSKRRERSQHHESTREPERRDVEQYSDDNVSDDYYEEEEVRSIVLLKGASEDSLSEQLNEAVPQRSHARESRKIESTSHNPRYDDRDGGERRSPSRRNTSVSKRMPSTSAIRSSERSVRHAKHSHPPRSRSVRNHHDEYY
jgi:NADPH:quinone reductase-like Zn-dependent oxidoreductase